MTVVDEILKRLPPDLRAEICENQYRKDWTASEIYAGYRKLLPQVKKFAKERQRRGGRFKGSAKFAEAEKGNTLDIIAQILSTSRGTLSKIIEVHEAAATDSRFRPFTEQMDREENVDAAFKESKRLKRRDTLQKADAITPNLPDSEDRVQHIDVWKLGVHRLMCGDSTLAEHVKTLLAGAVPPLMVTNQPWGVNYDPTWRARVFLDRRRMPRPVPNDDRVDWQSAYALFPGREAYVYHCSIKTDHVIAALEATGLVRRDLIICVKAGVDGHFLALREAATRTGDHGMKNDVIHDFKVAGIAAHCNGRASQFPGTASYFSHWPERLRSR